MDWPTLLGAIAFGIVMGFSTREALYWRARRKATEETLPKWEPPSKGEIFSHLSLVRRLVVDRGKWLCGPSCPVNKYYGYPDGFYDILGFAIKASGGSFFEREDGGLVANEVDATMLNMCASRPWNPFYEWEREVIEVNDSTEISNQEREDKIIELFAARDITVQFVGTYDNGTAE